MLAAESPFEGERQNALEAARRLASKKGMTLDEAAEAGPAPRRAHPQPESPTAADAASYDRRFATAMHLMDQEIRKEKARRAAAMRAAQERGLDTEERRAAARQARNNLSRPKKKARMNPYRHAAILLAETSLPFREIAGITGLNIYQVVGMKLKMRKAA